MSSVLALFGKRTPVEEMRRVWTHFMEFYEKLLLQHKANDPRILMKKEFRENLRKLVLILSEQDKHLGPNQNIGDCTEYLIQEQVFETFCAYIKTDKPPGFLAYGIGLVGDLLSGMKHQDLLNHMRMLTALLDLLHIVHMTLKNDGIESMSIELENNLISLLFILSKKTVQKPHISRMFFQGGYQQLQTELKSGALTANSICYPVEILISLLCNEMESTQKLSRFNCVLHKAVEFQLQIDDPIFQQLIFRTIKAPKGYLRPYALSQILVRKLVFHYNKLPPYIPYLSAVSGISRFNLGSQVRQNLSMEAASRLDDFIDFLHFFSRCARIIGNNSQHFQTFSSQFFNGFLILVLQDKLLAAKGYSKATQLHYFLMIIEILAPCRPMLVLLYRFLFGFPDLPSFDTPSTARSDQEDQKQEAGPPPSMPNGTTTTSLTKGKPAYSARDEALLRRLDLENHKQAQLETMMVKSLNSSRRQVMVQSLALATIDAFLRHGLNEMLDGVLKGFTHFIKLDNSKGQMLKRSRALGAEKFFQGFPKTLVPLFTRDETESFYLQAHSLVSKQFDMVTRTHDLFSALDGLSEIPSPNTSFLSQAFTVEQIFDSPPVSPSPALPSAEAMQPPPPSPRRAPSMQLNLLAAKQLAKESGPRSGRGLSARGEGQEEGSGDWRVDFVQVVFRKLQQFLENSSQENLVLTSIVAHLAAVPVLSTQEHTAILHYSLFQTLPVASNGLSCSLHSVLLKLVEKLEKYRNLNSWFDSLCDWRRRKLNVKCAYFQTFYSEAGEREQEFADQYEKMKATVDGVVALYEFLKELKAILHSKEKLATVFEQSTSFVTNELQEEELLRAAEQENQI